MLFGKRIGLVGSSPHTWRILQCNCLPILMLRIISTYVENTSICSRCYIQIGDHLHIRGEYCLIHCISSLILGSSPHTWRILVPRASAILDFGIISTYVENTKMMKQASKIVEDHLHIRGEYDCCSRI